MSESYTFTLCVHSAELDSAVQGSYCKIYLNHHDMSHGSHSNNMNHDLLFGRQTRSNSEGDSIHNEYHTTVETSQTKTKQPTWIETFCLVVRDRRSEMLTIRLKSKKLLHLSVIGACVIPIRQIPIGRMVDQWFPLLKGGKERGKLRLQLTIKPRPTVPGRHSLGPTVSVLRPVATHSVNDIKRDGGSEVVHHREQVSFYDSYSSTNQQLSPPSQPQQFDIKLAEERPQQYEEHQPKQFASSPPYLGQQPIYYDPSPSFFSHDPSNDIEQPLSRHNSQTIESSEDDEAYFPRVAELHRFDSDLIGPSSDEGDNQINVNVNAKNAQPQVDGSNDQKMIQRVSNSNVSTSSNEEMVKEMTEDCPDRSSWMSSSNESDDGRVMSPRSSVVREVGHGLMSLTTEEVPVYMDEHGHEHLFVSPQRSSSSTEYMLEEEEENSAENMLEEDEENSTENMLEVEEGNSIENILEEEEEKNQKWMNEPVGATVEVEKDVILMEDVRLNIPCVIENVTVVVDPPQSLSSEEGDRLEPSILPMAISLIDESHIEEETVDRVISSPIIPVGEVEMSEGGDALKEQVFKELLFPMSTRLTLEELNEAADDCLPSDSDSDSDSLDGDFNFDSD